MTRLGKSVCSFKSSNIVRMPDIRICKFIDKMIFQVSMENLTNDSVIPIIPEKEFEMESFVMSSQEYKNA